MFLDFAQVQCPVTLHAGMACANMVRSGLTASRSLTKPFCAGTGGQHLRRRALTSRAFNRRQFAVMAQATYDIWVKGSPEKNELGDCKLSTASIVFTAHDTAPYTGARVTLVKPLTSLARQCDHRSALLVQVPSLTV